MTLTKTLPVALAAAFAFAAPAFSATLNNGADAAAVRAAGMQQMASNGSLAVLYSPIVGMLRAKNVSAVTNPTTGIYCVTPITARPLAKSYQSVSAEWGWSSGSSLLAVVRDTADGYTSCGTNDYEVRTFDLTGNPSAAVAFFLEVY